MTPLTASSLRAPRAASLLSASRRSIAFSAARLAAACLLGTAPLFVAAAPEARAGDIRIVDAVAAPTLAGNPNGVMYIGEMTNGGARADRLVGASTPIAARVELHTMGVDAQGVMRMRPAGPIALEPNAPVRMQRGHGLHLMLMELKRPLKAGETFPATLEFERAGKTQITVRVDAAGPAQPGGMNHKP
ncbi:copper chaperone PCu(A)C [Piscinibacter koreensis]|uniref:Copper chaperone PCu(A)C n=1 Tax=Piscinibacter koreensis TaxID=2742824 RepID=A0A7Y6NKG7_9BURK|nr:copper chaperone PCu(A)C [Schlegelella koreensis]NUZ04870.1 copper chaperone PCu(A)C [Schlegelella koreensis]